MNIIVMNNSGNVGKSTLTQKLLAPRLENTEIIAIETLNSDGMESAKFKSEDFAKIFTDLLANGEYNYIIDIGASNIEEFYRQMEDHEGLTDAFVDYFIIPVTPVQKQQVDTINTLDALQCNDIDQDKIKFIFNMVDKKSDVADQFSYFIEQATKRGFVLNALPIVYETGLFDTLKDNDVFYDTVMNDNRDHKAELKNPESDKVELRKAMVYRSAYNSFHKNLDQAFEALSLEVF
ncbi:hypothetical protein U0D24_21940 [Hafnia paralvei]|uniref:hypothetical protein n=1 Tax=Hafnia paralvei TaxID=546367 RepID=UPI002FDC71E4